MKKRSSELSFLRRVKFYFCFTSLLSASYKALMKGGENWYARLEFFMPQIIAYLQHIMSHLIIRLLQNTKGQLHTAKCTKLRKVK